MHAEGLLEVGALQAFIAVVTELLVELVGFLWVLLVGGLVIFVVIDLLKW